MQVNINVTDINKTGYNEEELKAICKSFYPEYREINLIHNRDGVSSPFVSGETILFSSTGDRDYYINIGPRGRVSKYVKLKSLMDGSTIVKLSDKSMPTGEIYET